MHSSRINDRFARKAVEIVGERVATLEREYGEAIAALRTKASWQDFSGA